MTAAAIGRKYALTKITSGDYLLPSNNAETIWRIQRYEDGPSHGLVDWPHDRRFWRVLQWDGPFGMGVFVNVDNMDRWEEYATMYGTRREAIDAALQAS